MDLTFISKIKARFEPEKYLPKINTFYWVFFVSFTIFGQVAGNLIAEVLHLGYGSAALLFFLPLLVTVLISIYSKVQRLPLYWTIITLAGVCGTNISHYFSRVFFRDIWGYSQYVSYYFTTGLFIFILVVLFYIWNESPKTFTIREWLNKPTEIIYWITILIAGAIGTSVGDVVANNTLMCYDAGTVLLLQLLCLAIAMVYLTKVSRSFLFWTGIILTHPVGANSGDLLSQQEWLGLGNLVATVFMLVVCIIVIIIERKMPKKPERNIRNTEIYPHQYF